MDLRDSAGRTAAMYATVGKRVMDKLGNACMHTWETADNSVRQSHKFACQFITAVTRLWQTNQRLVISSVCDCK